MEALMKILGPCHNLGGMQESLSNITHLLSDKGKSIVGIVLSWTKLITLSRKKLIAEDVSWVWSTCHESVADAMLHGSLRCI